MIHAAARTSFASIAFAAATAAAIGVAIVGAASPAAAFDPDATFMIAYWGSRHESGLIVRLA